MSVGRRTETAPSGVGADSELGRALDAYLLAVESGRPLERALLAALHPDIADRLLACIAVLDVTAAPTAGGDDPPYARLGDFSLIRPIGRGGMGIVFEARQVSLRRRVAVKILPFAAALDPVNLGRFQVEARAAARLHHTNIVPVFSVGCERGVHYYAMQLIEGRTLAEMIRDLRGDPASPRTRDGGRHDEPPSTEPAVGPVSTARRDGPPPRAPGASHHRRVAELGVQAADALDHAHRGGVVHRDVKPSNLMLDAKGVLWIADFGLARLEADAGLTLAGDLLGTLRYMSPEQCSGDPSRVDARTDVYALGATLYELLTLRPAREGRDRDALLEEISSGEPRPPRSIDRSVPRDLETILLRALAREPDARYATAGAMADDLRRFLDGRAILARRPTPFALAAKWARRRKGLVASAVLAALLGVATVTSLSLAARNREFARAQARALYVRDIAQAAQHARRNDLDEAVRLLSLHIPADGAMDDRDFAWHYLWRLCHIKPRRLEGHQKDVYHVEYGPDGRTLATAGRDATIRLWDSRTGALLRTFRGHEGDVDSVAFSPDGRTLASCGDDGTVRTWDADDDARPSRVVGRADVEVVCVVFTPDGRSLLTGDHAGVLTRWDLDGGRPPAAGRRVDGRLGGLAIAPDGRTLATASSPRSRPAPGDEAPGFRILDLIDPGRASPAADFPFGNAVALSRDGRLAAGADLEGRVQLVAVNAGGAPSRVASFNAGFVVEGLAFSPDGLGLAGCGREGLASLWDTRTGVAQKSFRSGAFRLWSVAFSPDGRELAATRNDGGVDVWDLDDTQAELRSRPPEWFDSLVAPALTDSGLAMGRYDAARRTRSLVAWDFLRDSAWEAPPFTADLLAAAAAPGGRTLAVHDQRERGTIRLYDYARRDATRSLQLPQGWLAEAEAPRLSLLFSPDETRLTVWDASHIVLWDLADGRRFTPSEPAALSTAPGFSRDGSQLALVGGDVLRIWEPSTGALQEYPASRQGYPGPPAISPDGRLVAVGSTNSAIALWDRLAPSARPTILDAPGPPQALAFSPDGRTLAYSDPEGTTTLVDLPTHRPILRLDGPPSPFNLLRFASDGSTLVRFSGPEAFITTWTTSAADTPAR